MLVTCPMCGGASRDREFCDHCNADLQPPSCAVPSRLCPPWPVGLELSEEQISTLSRPEAAVVVEAENHLWRLHWLAPPAWESWRRAVTFRLNLSLESLPPGRVIESQKGTWVLVQSSGIPAQPWKERRPNDPVAQLYQLLRFLEPLSKALTELHNHGLVWLTFDPRELEEAAATEAGGNSHQAVSQLRLTNLDLEVFPKGRCPERLQVMPAFAAPEICRFQSSDIGTHTDVFHLALFSYYWLAGLLPQGFAGAGLEAFHSHIPLLRVFAPDLPPGIQGVLARGLSINPRQRQATPADFLAELQQAVARYEHRLGFAGPVDWEIGTHTRAGRAKTAEGFGNEDYVAVRQYAVPPRALLAVADGISTCDVGHGALASRLACIVLENTFDDLSDAVFFQPQITEAFQRGSQAILDWALERGYRRQLLQGRDLMGTTLTAAWLQDRHLRLAHVGDSRAYLVTAAGVDQLTIDGDLGTAMLAAGVPPEEVVELGNAARGLRTCVGGCLTTVSGQLQIATSACHPSHFVVPLLPGDVLILCSDGLVEEDAFLEPETLFQLVQERRDWPAAELASFLTDQADALQRLPSQLEPEGFGDNISCIVVKIEEVGVRE